MRILMVQETFLPRVGGAEMHVLRLAQAMQARGHDVRVLTATAGPKEWEGVRVIRLPFLAKLGRRRYVTVPLGYVAMLPWVAWAQVVHGHYSARMSRMAGRLAKLFSRPFVVTLHGYGTLDTSVATAPGMVYDRATSMQLSDRIIATSEEMGDIAAAIVPGKEIVVVPSGVAVDSFASIPRQRDPQLAHIITLRRLVPKNGVQFVVEALPEIQRLSDRDVRLTIIGEGSRMPTIRARAEELGVLDLIEFAGTVHHDRLAQYLACADVAVFASSAEATSLAALESMAAGVPIVATPAGSYPELIGDRDRGVMVELFESDCSTYDPPAKLDDAAISRLAQAVAEVLNDEQEAERMGADARRWVATRYDWSIIAEQVEGLYARE